MNSIATAEAVAVSVAEETVFILDSFEVPEEKYFIIPANLLEDNPFNPRRHYEVSSLNALASDFKMQGQSMPCVVRDMGNGRFQVAAGHRRVRAGRMAFGEEGGIKCLIRDLDDIQMHKLAVTENSLRENTSVIDESEACARMLELREGDRESAAADMHMKQELFERRLALLALGEAARQALAEKKIGIGVAELLAAVAVGMQEKVLPRIIEEKLTAEFVRAEVLRTSRPLGEAIFDKTECGGCQYNSDRQQGLFDMVIENGQCTNASCYRKKTLEIVEARAEELKDRFPAVVVIHKIDGERGIKINADQLGQEQAVLCKGCKDFGASVSNLPGSYGEIVEGVCLNAECNGEKKKAHSAAMKKKEKESGSKTEATQAASKDAPKAESTVVAASSSSAENKASTSGITKAVMEYRVQVWRKAIEGVAVRRPVEARIALLALAADHQAACLDNEVVAEQCDKSKSLVDRLVSYGSDEIESDLTAAAAKMASKAKDVSLPALLEHFACDLSEFFTADEAFLKLLTRSELESYAEEVGLKAAMGDSWKKANVGKKDEVIKAYLEVSGFDYSRVPSILIPN